MARVIDAVMSLKDKFSPVLRQVSKNMEQQSGIHKRLARDIESTGKSISNFGKATAFISAPLVAAAAAGFKLSQSLDKSTARVGMLGQMTAAETAKMKKNIVDLSNQTGVASETIADASQKAIVGGIKAGDSMKYMGDCIKYSKVAGMELGQTVENTNSYIKAYNLSADQAASIHDKMVITARLANVEMAVMSPTLAGVAKSAADAGVSVEQMDAAYAMMVKHGMDNGSAAAALSTLFESFTKASPKALKAAQEFGIELNRAHIQSVGFPAFLKEIQEKTGGNEIAMGKIIKDVKAFKLALSMTGNEAEFNDMLTQIQNSSGATAESLGKLKTPAGETVKAMNQIQNAGIELVDGLQPLWTSSAKMIKQLVDAFNSLSDEQKNMIFTAAKLIIVTTILSGTVGKAFSMFGQGIGTVTKLYKEFQTAGSVIAFLGTKFANLISIFKTIGAAARFLFMTPIGLAVLAVVVAVYLIYTHWGQLKTFFINLWTTIVGIFSAAVTAVTGWLNKMGITGRLMLLASKIHLFSLVFSAFWIKLKNNIIAFTTSIAAPVIAAFSNLWAAINGKSQSGSSFIVGILSIISAAFGVMVKLVGIYLSGFLDVVGVIITGIVTVLSGIITFITGVFAGNWAQAWQGVVEIFRGIFGTIEGICNTVMNTIKAAINAVIGGVNGISINIPDWVPMVGGQHFQPSIPMLAKGTDNWGGGPAMIHDAGPEIVDLPSGSRVIPHSESMKEEYNRGIKDGAVGGNSFKLEKLADQIIVREEADIDKIVERLAYKMKSYAINQAEGAI